LKKFNAVEMIRKIRDKQYEDIKDMTNKEIIQYFKKRSQDLRKQIKKPAGNLT
jgi:hypothetical protein